MGNEQSKGGETKFAVIRGEHKYLSTPPGSRRSSVLEANSKVFAITKDLPEETFLDEDVVNTGMVWEEYHEDVKERDSMMSRIIMDNDVIGESEFVSEDLTMDEDVYVEISIPGINTPSTIPQNVKRAMVGFRSGNGVFANVMENGIDMRSATPLEIAIFIQKWKGHYQNRFSVFIDEKNGAKVIIGVHSEYSFNYVFFCERVRVVLKNSRTPIFETKNQVVVLSSPNLKTHQWDVHIEGYQEEWLSSKDVFYIRRKENDELRGIERMKLFQTLEE